MYFYPPKGRHDIIVASHFEIILQKWPIDVLLLSNRIAGFKRKPWKHQSDVHCNRSATSPRPKFITIAEVAEESQLGFAFCRRLVGHWPATNRGLVDDWSATGRRPRGDLFATWCNWSLTGPRLVADQSPIGRRPSKLKSVIKKKNIDTIF